MEIEIDPSDLRIDTYRASGAGGQHVNRTDSAVRITHEPSGIVVQCQSQRSQHQNKDFAMKQLRAKLYEREMDARRAEAQALEDSKADIGWGSQIRSYVLDSSRIKDLRTGVETSNTQSVLDGALDPFIEASLKQGTVMNDHTTPEIEVDENQLIAERQKLSLIRNAEGPTFPNDFRRSHLALDLAQMYGSDDKRPWLRKGVEVAVCGRVMLRRIMGKASFLTIQDAGGRIQLYARKADLPDGVYDDFKTWDIGDIIGGRGALFKTNTGELSVHLTEIRLLTKSLRPLPDKHKGLTDTEQRYRQRYVDLMTNDETRHVFTLRSKVIAAIRHFFESRDFLEVETPMLQVIPGGATARFILSHITMHLVSICTSELRRNCT